MVGITRKIIKRCIEQPLTVFDLMVGTLLLGGIYPIDRRHPPRKRAPLFLLALLWMHKGRPGWAALQWWAQLDLNQRPSIRTLIPASKDLEYRHAKEGL